MMRKLWQVQTKAWLLLAAVGVVAIGSAVIRTTGVVESSQFLYFWQPIALFALAVMARLLAGGLQSRSRHRAEKTTIVGSIIAIWFVVYMMSGVLVTFVQNALVSSFGGVVLNVFSFGVAAVMLEYTRYKLMLLVGRRNAIWFGVVVASVFAMQQMSLSQLGDVVSAADLVKLTISTYIPAVLSSFLLTYLAISSGIGAMLTYQLGIVAATILPPIIPKYDWYLIGTSSILLTLTVYVAIDRNAHGRETNHRKRAYNHVKRANDVMLITTMVGLIMFMVGAFTYKPLAILSNSMVPVFSRGAVVIVQKVDDPMDVNEGDIVQYEVTGHTVTHRVVAIDNASDGSGERVFTTKGDNSPSSDPPVKQQQITGIIRSQIPYIGYPTVWLHDLAR